jgi:UDP-N-acetyl-D-mannosaminuronic acid dehydrogenase
MNKTKNSNHPNQVHKNSTSNIDLTIIGGAGHIGLPLALIFAKSGLRVLIHDINKTTLELIQNGFLPYIEYGAEDLLRTMLKEKRLFFSYDFSDIPDSGPIVITIGTPVDEFLNPVHSYVKNFFVNLKQYINSNHLLILRSTVYPGTTDWLAKLLQSENIFAKLAFCPERIVQGYALQELSSMPQIIGGIDAQSEMLATKLFKLISSDVVCVKPIEAEFAKLFSNSYRYIQFAVSNQFYMIADAAGVNYSNIVHAMTHSYPRMQGFPSAGFAAGPCLFKDTMQLSSFAQNQFSIGSSAMLANEGLPLYVIEKIKKTFDLNQLTVGLLGMAFKPEIDDIRSSLSYKIKKILLLSAKKVLTTDPYVNCDPDLTDLETTLNQSDIFIMCTPHTCYRTLDFQNKPVIDVWGIVNKNE